MTLNKLASLIAKREGKKHQASIGDIREILKIIVAIDRESKSYGSSPIKAFIEASGLFYVKSEKKRAKKKTKRGGR